MQAEQRLSGFDANIPAILGGFVSGHDFSQDDLLDAR
jgi:hypothetical protein